MFYAYVLKSPNHEVYYKGHCKDLRERIKQHNSGKTASIRAYIPFELVYKEEFNTREEAIAREKYFKTSAGRRYIKNKLLRVSEAPDPGSLPTESAGGDSWQGHTTFCFNEQGTA